MAKKANNNILKLVNDDGNSNRILFIYPVFLIIGSWKKLFSADQNKIIIAEALNYCTSYEWMNVAGYLITDRRVCLVLEIDKAEIHNMLNLFYERVKKEMKHRLEKRKHKNYNDRDWAEIEEHSERLFIRYEMESDYLVRLITGRKVELPYYNSHLERLKDKIHEHDFCSAIDYSGGVGPVIVKLLNNENSFLLQEDQ